MVSIIQCMYANSTCSVRKSELGFEVKTGVRQGCVMSATLFNIVIDWVLHPTTEDKPMGIRWTLLSKLEDLDFADDLAGYAVTHTQPVTGKNKTVKHFW